MSSLIGDPFWRAAGYFIEVANDMNASEWASWVQAVGSVGAIVYAYIQGRGDTKKRQDEESNQRLIRYQIAEDIFIEILDHFAQLTRNCEHTSGLAKDEIDKALPLFESNLKLLDGLVLELLPGSTAAIDVQEMRSLSYTIIKELASVRTFPGYNAYSSLRTLLPNLRRWAQIKRGDAGPEDPVFNEHLAQRRARRRELKLPAPAETD